MIQFDINRRFDPGPGQENVCQLGSAKIPTQIKSNLSFIMQGLVSVYCENLKCFEDESYFLCNKSP